MTRRSEPRTPSRSLPTVRLEHLWFALALTIVGCFIALAPTTPRDFWWHLKAGELVATTGIPTTNLFAWSLPADTPYTYQSWLGEWLFFILYRVGGLPLTVFTRNMLGLIAFALVGIAARQRSGSWRLAAGAVLLAFSMTINNLTTRPQNWSWVPFTLTLVVCVSYAEGTLRPRWLLVLPLLMLFWVNVHGGFVMGLLVVGAFVVGESVRRWLRQPRALTWERIRALALASGGMLIATLANPLGPGVYRYVYKLLTDAPSQTLVKEWQPPTPHTLAGACFYLGVLALLAAFAFARRKPSITDVLLVCGLAWQAFVGTRYVVWFGMAAMPIAAQSLVAARPLLHSAGESHTHATPRISRRERGGWECCQYRRRRGAGAECGAGATLVQARAAIAPTLSSNLRPGTGSAPTLQQRHPRGSRRTPAPGTM